ncbi:MAG: 4-hydroxy-tetrahydrodipicolinate synthase [Sulfobacillus thermosulfidooxidans]|nr:MAG: 4-hydroxy-tetrahydrodipicolinate synthase [Sulfobacillus thermosulfidooxidans]
MRWPRVFTAMITPFTEEGSIDVEAAEGLARHLVAHGTQGVILAGSTGEAFSLSPDERYRLYTAVRRGAGDMVPVWMGCGTNDTRSTVDLAMAADEWGADGVLVVSPYYNKPSQEGLIRHFGEVLHHVTCPVMLYNVPSRTASMVEADTVAKIARKARAPFAVKEASGTIEQIIRLDQILGSEVPIFSGDDSLYLASLAVGAYGVVSVASHVVGMEMEQMTELFISGHPDEARMLHADLWPLFKQLFVVSNPIPLKWLLHRLALAPRTVRMPLVMPEDAVFGDLWLAYLRAKHIRQMPISSVKN